MKDVEELLAGSEKELAGEFRDDASLIDSGVLDAVALLQSGRARPRSSSGLAGAA